MTGTDLNTVSGPIPTVGARLPAESAEDRSESEPRVDAVEAVGGPAPHSEGQTDPAPHSEGQTERLIEVMLALSGHLDIEEPDGPSAAKIDAGRSHATLERLAMLGMSFGF